MLIARTQQIDYANVGGAEGSTPSRLIPIKLSKFPIALDSWTKRQDEVTSHSRSYGEELQRSIFVQLTSAIGDLESAIGIISPPALGEDLRRFC